jgi:hypothetical protein
MGPALEVHMVNMNTLTMRIIASIVVPPLMGRAQGALMGNMNTAMVQTNVFFVDQHLLALVHVVLMASMKNKQD